MDDKLYWLALNMVPGIGPVAFRNLLATFDDPKSVLLASPPTLGSVNGIGEKTIRAIKDTSSLKFAEKESRRAQELGIAVVTLRDGMYPKNLLQIYDPPPVLYVRGRLTEDDSLAVSIVGSRKSSPYGRSVTKRLSHDLASIGIRVVSGMARGIDTVAHHGALEARGRTIAVLGCGADVIYPRENKKLFFDIIDNGAIISEFPLATPPEGKNFPKRNRIISGLSLGVVIVEAAADSGSLITATHALEQGREVFAIPGNVGASTSQGTNRLIKQGAKLIEGAEDVIEEIAPQCERQVPREAPPVLSNEEQGILDLLSHTPIHIDEISRKSQMEIHRVSVILLDLELKGLVCQLGGKTFVLR